MGFFVWVVVINVFISFFIPFIMLFISILVNKVYFNVDVFECGFDSFNVSVFPVSLRFFMFCVIFLILDLELVLMFLCPLILFFNLLMINFYFFILLVFLGLLVEWVFGSISWVE